MTASRTIKPPIFLIGFHPTRGRLWASVAEARFVEPSVTESRFGAYCTPFKSENHARAALKAAGAEHIQIEVRAKRARHG